MTGGVVNEPGSTMKKKTGSWRSQKPIVDKTKCIKCGTCAKLCPDAAIVITENGAEIDYDYCKGCLICKTECPVKCISSEEEVEQQ